MERNCENCCYYGSCTENTPCRDYIHIEQLGNIADIMEGIYRDWDLFSYEQQKELSLYLDEGEYTKDIEDSIVEKYIGVRRSDYYNEWFEYIGQF